MISNYAWSATASYVRDLRQHCLAGKGRQSDPYYRIGPMGARISVLVIYWDISSERSCMVIMRCRWPEKRRHVLRGPSSLASAADRRYSGYFIGTYPGCPATLIVYSSCPGEQAFVFDGKNTVSLKSFLICYELNTDSLQLICQVIKVAGPFGETYGNERGSGNVRYNDKEDWYK